MMGNAQKLMYCLMIQRSSWYLEQHNFCVYGGMKSNFQGHNKRTSDSLHAFATVYGDCCVNGLGTVSPEFAEGEAAHETTLKCTSSYLIAGAGYSNNVCILTKSGDPYIEYHGSCPTAGYYGILGNNTIYSPGSGCQDL